MFVKELKLREQIISCYELCLLSGAIGQTSDVLQNLFQGSFHLLTSMAGH